MGQQASQTEIIVGVIKNGPTVYEFLKKLIDNNIEMEIKWPDASSNRIVIEAISPNPFSHHYYNPPYLYRSRENYPKKFQVIEIICNNAEMFRNLMARFHRADGKVSQTDVISYMKAMWDRYGNTDYNIRSVVEHHGEEWIPVSGLNRLRAMQAYKLTLTID